MPRGKRAVRIVSETNGPRSLRQHHDYRVCIVRTDGTPVVYEKVKHVMYQSESLLLIIGEHDKNREYVRYPAHIIDHVISQEL